MLVLQLFFCCTAPYRLTLLLVASLQLQHAAARTVAEAPDLVTDPTAVLTKNEPQAVATVPQAAADPQLTVADIAVPTAVAAQLIMTQSADTAVVPGAAERADTTAGQLQTDTSANMATAWNWKPPFGNPPGLGAGAGASTNCAAGGCVTATSGTTTIPCAVGASMKTYTDLFPTGRFIKGDFRCEVVCLSIIMSLSIPGF